MTVDTVQPLWEKLEAELEKAKDIDSVIRIHQNFILKVLCQYHQSSDSPVFESVLLFGDRGNNNMQLSLIEVRLI